MRQQIREVIEATKSAIQGWHEDATEPGELTDDELLERYLNFHKGRASALIDFAGREGPQGRDVIAQAARYEQRMEELLRRKDAER